MRHRVIVVCRYTKRWDSLWPVRSGVIVTDGVAYFSAGLVPTVTCPGSPPAPARSPTPPRHAYIGDDAFTFHVSDSFTTSATATITIHLAITDADGDGFTNQQEYQANTNPKDADSLLKILGVTPIGAGYRVSFSTSSNVFYRVERCDDLARFCLLNTIPQSHVDSRRFWDTFLS